ncbi:MAG: DNA repair protein RecO [Candidatus Pacebacteria bacterium]|nr:DNA repair protein RecO [Candidatus Paceibacterota bacterium]
MHHIYHTKGVILSSRNFGEAGRYYHILTNDLGLIFVSAQGVRKMESKLRYVLQDGSYINVDLIRAKDFWKVTTASKRSGLDGIVKDRNKFHMFCNIGRLLKRLLPGEEINEELFSDFIKGLKILETSKEEEINNIEVMIVLRILYHLGYIGEDGIANNLTKSPLEKDLVFEVSKKRANILREINKALRETQL